jgi:L-aspartate oxidase
VLGPRVAERFPAITAACRRAGIDPVTHPIPIRPAAHFHMGGVATDATGRTSIDGLWAVGEVASTGLHGANRLASNSLLEAAVMADWVAQDIGGLTIGPATLARPSAPPRAPASPSPALVRPILSAAAGVLRDGNTLAEAAERLRSLVEPDGPASDPALVAWAIVTAALRRAESRGSHFRTDFPMRDDHRVTSRQTLRWLSSPDAARLPQRAHKVAA